MGKWSAEAKKKWGEQRKAIWERQKKEGWKPKKDKPKKEKVETIPGEIVKDSGNQKETEIIGISG